jgi:hypothetical protein
VVFVPGDMLAGFLDGNHRTAQMREPDDMPGNTARKSGQVFRRPLFQRDMPGQVKQAFVGGGRSDVQRAQGRGRSAVVRAGQFSHLPEVGRLVVPVGVHLH